MTIDGRKRCTSTTQSVGRTLAIPDGPWCAPTWQVVEPTGDRRRKGQGIETCAVNACGGERYWLGGPTTTGDRSGLCYAHYFQWFRAGQPPDFTEWAATDAKPTRQPRGRSSMQVVDFRCLPPAAADEIRFVVATKVQRGDWTCNASLRRFLILLISAAETRIASSFTERSTDDWLMFCRQEWPYTSSFETLCAPHISRFFHLLNGATNPNLWVEDHWHWVDGFEFLLGVDQSGSTHIAIDWSTISVPWLRVAVKDLARRQLTTATLSWGTLTHWARAARQLACYLTLNDQAPAPPDVIERVDELIVNNPGTDPTLRAMIATTRWAGCRISELVALPIDCLHHSRAGYWIEYWMPETRAWRRIPVPDTLAAIIWEQQTRVRNTYSPDAEHLFPGGRSSAAAGRTQPWSTSGLRHKLSALFTQHGITTSTITGETISGGDVHRFRHTVGMTLLNNGWTQQEVRDFLGHHSDTMTSAYARITDDTLARKAREFWDNEAPDARVEHLRAKFTAALPNGFCTLPASQQCEFRPNPCLNCSFHDTGGRVFLGAHIAHRDELQRLVADAAEHGDTEATAINVAMLDKVTKIISEISAADSQEQP